MSVATATAPAEGATHHEATGLWSWITTVDHKRIGIMYFVTSLFFLFVGGLEAMFIRLQLFSPENDFITAETYYGRHGYSLKLDGLEEGVNDKARERLIVLHGAHYVSEDRADDRLIGRSWGCPAVRPGISKALIDAIKEGSVLWIYYPYEEWLGESEFLDEE